MLNNSRMHSIYLLFFPTLFLGLIFQIIRLPEIIAENRPDFIILVLIFFAMIDNRKVTLEFAWITGLILDFLSGAPLGINALMLAAQFYLIVSQFSRFPLYHVWQQAIIIGIVNLIVHVIGYWIEHLIGISFYQSSFLISSGILILAWPVFFIILTMLCAAFSIPVKNKDNGLN